MALYIAISSLYQNNEAFNFWCLKRQTDLDFTVVLLDVHHSEETAEMVDQYRNYFPIVHVNYRVPEGGRMFDWGVWNSSFLLPEKDDDFVYRFQSWRLIPSNTIQQMKKAKTNVGFIRTEPMTIPPYEADRFSSTALTPDVDSDVTPLGTYGDWCWNVKDYLTLNGIDEPATSIFHFEDCEQEVRWRIASKLTEMMPWVRWKGWTLYMDQDSRREWLRAHGIRGDNTGKHNTIFYNKHMKLCERCQRQWPQLQASNDPKVTLEQLEDNEDAEDLGIYFGKKWMFCARCDSVTMHTGTPHFSIDNQGDEYRATIGLAGRWGRNLRKARERCLALPVEERAQYVADSYWDKEVLIP